MRKLLLILLSIPVIGFSQNSGCTDSLAYNYDSLAVIDDGSCFYLGCLLSQIGQDIDGEGPYDNSGYSVSLSSDGSIVAIGAVQSILNDTGYVRIYENIAGSWSQIGQDIDGEAVGDIFGRSVSLSSDGNIVAIGAPLNDGNGTNSGHVRIYENIGGAWSQIGQDIDGANSGAKSGTSLSLSGDGNTVAIGGYNQVEIWENIGGTWNSLVNFVGDLSSDSFGHSVSLSSDGSVVAIGAPQKFSSDPGYVRIFERNGWGSWFQIGQDFIGEAYYDRFGYSVSLSSDGSIVAIGAPLNDGNGTNSGHVRTYRNNAPNSWIQMSQDIDGKSSSDNFGYSVSLSSDGNKIAIGAKNAGFGSNNAGQVSIFQKPPLGPWFQIGQDIDGEASDDVSGWSVSLSSDGNTVAVGAIGNAGNGTDAGHVRIYDFYYNFNTSTSSFAITSCDSYIWEGIIYDSTGIYTYAYTGANGCDSLVNLDLTINNSSSSVVTVNLCDTTHLWDSVTYDSTGVYTNIYTRVNGCDSVVILDLTINYSFSSTVSATACDFYLWDDVIYNNTGLYTNTYTNVNGCDSTVTLYLTINNSSTSTVPVTACDFYVWDDLSYNTTGLYTNAYTDFNGCDSIVTLDLTINSAEFSSIWQTGNELNAITFNNNSIEVDWYNIQTNFEVTRIWLMEEQSSSFKPSFDCSYFIIYEDDFGCIDTSSVYYYSENAKRIGTIITSPNPTSNIVKAQFDNPKNQNVKLELINSNGIKLDKFFTTYDNLEIDLSKYPSGTYYLYFNSEDALQGCRLEEPQKILSKIILNK
ncbi:T9SS type A sorting domain-containing protein [Flavobacteriales bacterium]|nr:T9SS type A sorting domain-containing protein [Flavobacteriales bacterium]